MRKFVCERMSVRKLCNSFADLEEFDMEVSVTLVTLAIMINGLCFVCPMLHVVTRNAIEYGSQLLVSKLISLAIRDKQSIC